MSGTDCWKCFANNSACLDDFGLILSPTQDLRSDVEVLRAARGAEAPVGGDSEQIKGKYG